MEAELRISRLVGTSGWFRLPPDPIPSMPPHAKDTMASGCVGCHELCPFFCIWIKDKLKMDSLMLNMLNMDFVVGRFRSQAEFD